EMSAPTCVLGFMGSPMRMALVRATSLSRNACLILRCTNTRVPFEHTFPAELQGDVFERRRRRRHDGLAGTYRPCERYLVDPRMLSEQAPGFGVPLQDLEHTFRQPRFAQHLAQTDRGQRREVRWLEKHGVTTGERRGSFPTRDLQRIVPGANAGDHSQGLAPGITKRLRTQIQVLARQGGR